MTVCARFVMSTLVAHHLLPRNLLGMLRVLRDTRWPIPGPGLRPDAKAARGSARTAA